MPGEEENKSDTWILQDDNPPEEEYAGNRLGFADEADEIEEEEYLPPDDGNKAPKFNVGNALLVIIVAVGVIVSLVTVFGSIPEKREEKIEELDKAGSKYIPSFTRINDSPVGIDSAADQPEETEKDGKTIDEIIEGLPEQFDLPEEPAVQSAPKTAPAGISGVGSKSSGRPDTRNSNSVRTMQAMDGLADGNIAAVSKALSGINGNDPAAAYAAGITERQNQYMEQISRSIQAMNGESSGENLQSNRERFFSANASGGGNGEWMSYASLWDGTIIPAALVTAINTDNPGIVIARVTENVYSSYDSAFLLIPEGSTLFATYNSSVSYGQDRIQVAWNLLIRPDGYRLQLGNMNGVDAQGMSGYRGNVSNHPFETAKALGLVWIYSMIQTEMSQGLEYTGNMYLENAMTDTYAEVSRIGGKIIDRALDIKPTITIPAGTEVKLITNIPLELPPVRINQVTNKYIRTR